MSARRVVGATTGWENLFSDQEASSSSNDSWDIIRGPWTPTQNAQAPAPVPEPETVHASTSSPEEQDTGVSEASHQGPDSGTDADGAVDGSGWGAISGEAGTAASSDWGELSGDVQAAQSGPGWWEGLLDPEVCSFGNPGCAAQGIAQPKVLAHWTDSDIAFQSFRLYSCSL